MYVKSQNMFQVACMIIIIIIMMITTVTHLNESMLCVQMCG